MHKNRRHTECIANPLIMNQSRLIFKQLDPFPYLHATIVPDIQDELKKFYLKNICADFTTICRIEAATLHQNNSVWSKERSCRITASTAHSLKTYSRNSKADWISKVNRFLTPCKFTNRTFFRLLLY